jgi:NADP-dependent 3-hydroxy acid dehydrogenase YdfG
MSGISGKVILVSGASSGIGEATARELARRGVRVVLGARRTGRLEKFAEDINASGGTARFRALDVTKAEDFAAFAGFAHQEFARLTCW